jgi:hypothetical protein
LIGDDRARQPSIVVARLDRAIQYSRALIKAALRNTNALEYWVTRFRG